MSTATKTQSTPEPYPGASLTGDVLVTIRATSTEEAVSLAASIPGFTIDASVPVIDSGDGQYIVVGNAAQPIVSEAVVGVDPNEQIQIGDPDSSIQ